MIKTLTQFVLVTLIALGMFSCKDDTFFDPPASSNNGNGFFSTEIGKFIEYQVDSARFDTDIGVNDTVSYFYRDEVVETFVDLVGDTLYRVERYRKDTEPDEYQIEKTYTVKRTNTTGETFIDNLRFISMTFPVESDVTWEGNVFINTEGNLSYLRDWEFEYQNINETTLVNGLSFDNVITVVQTDTENLIELRKSTETYAKDLGLIHKELRILEKQDLNATWDFPETGFVIEMTVIDHN